MHTCFQNRRAPLTFVPGTGAAPDVVVREALRVGSVQEGRDSDGLAQREVLRVGLDGDVPPGVPAGSTVIWARTVCVLPAGSVTSTYSSDRPAFEGVKVQEASRVRPPVSLSDEPQSSQAPS